MADLTGFLQADHRTCDLKLVDIESGAQHGDWPKTADALRKFKAFLSLHLAREEEVLFPALEAATGESGGPTAVMRSEHEQMRGLLAQLDEAVQAQDGKRCLGLTDTLMVLVQQHNMKEEHVLYPMADQLLGGDDALAERLYGVQPVPD